MGPSDFSDGDDDRAVRPATTHSPRRHVPFPTPATVGFRADIAPDNPHQI